MTGTLFGSLTIENEQPVLLLPGRMFRARLFAEHQQTTLSNAYIQHASMHLYNSFCLSKPNDESQHVHIQLCYTSPWTLRFTAAYEDLSIAPEVEERLKATVSRAYLYSLMIYTRGGRVALQYGAKGLRGRQ